MLFSLRRKSARRSAFSQAWRSSRGGLKKCRPPFGCEAYPLLHPGAQQTGILTFKLAQGTERAQNFNLKNQRAKDRGDIVCYLTRSAVDAVLFSKVTYAASFCTLNKMHFKRLGGQLNQAKRTILGLPRHTKLEELRESVFLPEFEEVLRLQREVHNARLQHTAEGRATEKSLCVSVLE